MSSTGSQIASRLRPRMEEKEIMPSKKTGYKTPANKGDSAARGTIKSSLKAAIKLDTKTKKILKTLESFHEIETEKVASDSFECKNYDGQLVEETPQGKSDTMKAIAEFNFDTFFNSGDLSTAESGEVIRRPLPEGLFVMDGATGSELDRRGVDCSIPLWSATANLVAHDVLKAVHKHFLMNGAKAVTTNSFATNERRLAKIGLGHLSKALTYKAAELAVAARDEVNPDALVLGCVAPEGCFNAELSKGRTLDELKKDARQTMETLLEAGCDFLLMETHVNAREAIAQCEIAQELAPGHWGVSFSIPGDSVGVLRCGTPIKDVVHHFKDAAFIGINCLDGRQVLPHVKHLKSIAPEGVRIAAYGNIGSWLPPKEYKAGIKKNNDVKQDAMYVKCVKEWIEAGADIVGGCCGTTPDTIRMLASSI